MLYEVFRVDYKAEVLIRGPPKLNQPHTQYTARLSENEAKSYIETEIKNGSVHIGMVADGDKILIIMRGNGRCV